MAIVLNNITSGYNLAKINANFQNIEDYINDKLLARADTGVAGEAMMERALDMNGNKILNVFVDVNDANSLLTVGVADSRYYNVSGDTLTGPMNANSQIINNLPTPVQPSQPATKAYADAIQADVDFVEAHSLRFIDTIGTGPSSVARANSLQGYDNNGNPIPVFSMTDTADLAIKLASHSAGLGAGLVGVEQGGDVQDLLRFVTPESMTVDNEKYLHGVTADATKFIQAAIDYGNVNNVPVLLTRMYPCISAPVEFNLPYDDGTVYPAWVGSGDANIAPETPVKAKAALRAYDNTIIIGKNHHTCGIIGNFSKAAGPWDHTSAMGIYLAGDSGPDQYIKYSFSNFSISSFFIGLWVDGTIDRCVEDSMRISGCAIPACYQGADSLEQSGLTHYRSNLGGPVFGGRWLTRNHAYASQYLPPYPASDIHRAGWNDSYHCEKFHYYGDTTLNWTHPAYAAVDTWFDTYVFKSANSAPTASGGRLSNNQQPGVYPVDTYKGVTGRARTIYSRYGREILHCNIQEAKVLWSPRTPFHQSAQFVGPDKSYVGNSKIGTVILERVGIINYSAGDVAGNRFNVNNVDPYEPTLTVFPAMATRGNIFAMDIVKGGAVQTAPINEYQGSSIGAGMNYMSQRNSGDATSYRMLGLQERNGTSLTDKYVFNRDYAFVQPLTFSASNARFKYDYGTFTPSMTVGGVSVTPSSIIGVYHRFGDIIRCDIRVRSSTLVIGTPGAIVISGLPFTAATIQEGSSKGNAIVSTATGVFVAPLVTPGTTNVTFIRSSAQELYSQAAGTFDFTLQTSFDYVVPFNA